jgi:hypothetical protein
MKSLKQERRIISRKVVRDFTADDSLLKLLRETTYCIGITAVPWLSFYDHALLTAGVATSLAEELIRRGKQPEEICGLQISSAELRLLACLCGFFWDAINAWLKKPEYESQEREKPENVLRLLAEKLADEELRKILLSTFPQCLEKGPQTLLGKVVLLGDSYAGSGESPEREGTPEGGQPLTRFEEAKNYEEELFGDEPPLRLLFGDADSVKDYVYETQVLPEIRGASQILVEVERKVRDVFSDILAEECLIYCGGGGFLAIIPASMAEELKQKIEKIYLDMTQTSTITVAHSDPLGYAHFARGLAPHKGDLVKNLPAQGVAADLLFSHFDALLRDRLKRKNFGELVSAVMGRVQEMKRKREFAPFFETLPIHSRCESCGKRSAVEKDEVRGDRICEICKEKRRRGREERRHFLEEFVRWANNTGVKIRLRDSQGKYRYPLDFETLAGPQGKLALFYADGNNMGEMLQLMPSPASYRHFSEAIDSATKEALFRAILNVFSEERLNDQKKPIPFEIIVLGGDDIVIALPAEDSWKLALEIIKEFENHEGVKKLAKELSERLREGVSSNFISLTLSAGLAIADVKYPVRFLFSLVEGLLKKAKKLSRSARTSTICHLWLRVPVISESADDMLDALYNRNFRYYSATLTARPYTLKDAEKLTNLAKELLNLSPSQRHGLAEALEKGVYVSTNYALYQAARLKGTTPMLNKVLEDLGKLPDHTGNSLFFWRNIPGEGWKTALLDALELIELGAVGT